jgi:hypothetical protein
MGHETESPNSDEAVLKAGDDIEKMRSVAQRAIDEGSQHDDGIYIDIPVENDLTYWGTGIWHFTEDGRMGRANQLFSEMLSEATGREIVINGFATRRVEETGNMQAVLMATVKEK